jgi:phosphoribosylformylglycinamidine cyclo-ligase
VPITYRESGVDVAGGEALVDRIKGLAASATRPEVVGGIGGFAGLCRIPEGYRRPLLVACTDGVGTKIKIAVATNRHEGIGIDLVAMSVNDLATTGAEPLFFLDYLVTGRLVPGRDERVIAGIAAGCREAGCALLGGETAEHPGDFEDDEYDLGGFAVGVVEEDGVLDGRGAMPGDALVGVASSGLHSNGFSLARKVLCPAGVSFDEVVPSLGASLADELLRPTRIYVRAMAAAKAAGRVHSAAHVTGGGPVGNVARALPEGLAAELHVGTWDVPPIFDLIAEKGPVETDEMRRTFNLGLGLVLVVAAEDGTPVVRALRKAGERASLVGRVVEADGRERVRFVG